jgi:hypothetical protein
MEGVVVDFRERVNDPLKKHDHQSSTHQLGSHAIVLFVAHRCESKYVRPLKGAVRKQGGRWNATLILH